VNPSKIRYTDTLTISHRKSQTGNRKLILTADDFGLSPSLNAAVGLAHKFGSLTCASLMVAGPAAAHALAPGQLPPPPGLGRLALLF